MENLKKYNDNGMEIRKPFTFKHLEVNIEPKEVMDSHEGFLYLQGENKTPSAMIPSENPFDPYIETVCQTSVLYSFDNIKKSIRDAAEAIAYRYNCTNEQNANIIFNNGLKSFISNYIIHDHFDIDYFKFNNMINLAKVFPNELFGHNISSIKKDTEDDFFNSYAPRDIDFLDLSNPNIEIKMTDNITYILILLIKSIGTEYSRIISYYIKSGILDIHRLCIDAMKADEIDPKTIDKSVYVSYATAILNQIAVEDINKFKETVIINNTQVMSEYLDILHIIYNDNLEKDIKELPNHKDTARIYRLKK